MPPLYQTRLVPLAELDDACIDTMTRLYLAHYDGSNEARFRQDLAEKSEVLLLWAEEELAGFSSFLYYSVMWRGESINIVYSGDTIVSPQHWKQQAMTFAGIARLGMVKRRAPQIPLYWFLLVKGHRTYKYLPVFAKTFFPHWARSNADLKALADHLASARFGADYDSAVGLVRFPVSHGHLNEKLAKIGEREQNKLTTRFFLEKNPDYRLGHELVCVCELTADNMQPLAARLFCGA
jgi:hypothetical protein